MDPIEQAQQEHKSQMEQSQRWYERAVQDSQETLRIAQEPARKLDRLTAARAATARRIDRRERAKVAIAAASLLVAIAAVCIAILH